VKLWACPLGWAEVRRIIIRWTVAVLVTVAAFAASSWICGALVLSTVMKDPGIRWGVAGALGVAVAALAALWGHSFATAERPVETASHGTLAATPKTTGSGSTRNKIGGGIFHGTVTQGRDISGSASSSGSTQPQIADPKTQG
jgi:hypothetical protein